MSVRDIRILKDGDIERKWDRKISIALMSSFVILTVQYFFLIIFKLSDTAAGNSIQILSKGLVGVIYLSAIPIVLRRSFKYWAGTYIVTIVLFVVNILLFPENWPYLKEIIFPLFLMCLPSFLYSMSIVNWDELKNIMEKASIIVFFIGFSIGVLVFLGKVSIGSYSMPLSYYMLLPAIHSLDALFERMSVKATIYFVISTGIILSFGSRGAVLCIIAFIILRIISIASLNIKSVRIGIIASITTILISFNYQRILTVISDVLGKFGIHSRSIILFLKGDVYLSGRDTIFEKVFSEIKANPVLGLGLTGDRRIVGKSYVHNIALEIIANFGIIFGVFVIGLLIFSIYKSLSNKDARSANMIIIWMSLGLVHLFVSSSYLIDLKFWIFAGLLTKSLSTQNSCVKDPLPINTRGLVHLLQSDK